MARVIIGREAPSNNSQLIRRGTKHLEGLDIISAGSGVECTVQTVQYICMLHAAPQRGTCAMVRYLGRCPTDVFYLPIGPTCNKSLLERIEAYD